MSWQLTLAMLAVVNSSALILNKVISDKLPKKKSQGVFVQFLVAAVISTVYFSFSDKGNLFPVVFWIGLVGFFNAFGAWCQWQALGISLSKSVLFLPLMEVVTILLAVTFLSEGSLWTWRLILGAILCFLAMFMFRFASMKAVEEEKKKMARKLILYVTGMVLIFGIAGFFLKFFSEDVTRGTFLISWYIGAFLATPLMLFKERVNPGKLPRETLLACSLLGAVILGSLFLLYWTYQLGGPVSMVSPTKGIAILFIPAVVGWLIFGEKGKLSKLESLAFIPGIAGALLILIK